MCTLRLSLAGTVIVVLLGGLSGVALAQDEAEPETPIVVTGLEKCGTLAEGMCEEVDGVTHCRGTVSGCQDDMSDPRVTGYFTNTFNADYFDGPSGRLYWGTHVLDRAAGGWDCTWVGLEDPYPDSGNDGLAQGVCAGTGDYAGLTYVWHHVFAFGYPSGLDASFGDGTDIHGIIYADELPSVAQPAVTEE